MKKEGFVYLILFSLGLGISIVINKVGLNAGLNPTSFVFSRSIIAAVFSLAYVCLNKTHVKNLKKADWKNLIILGIIASGIDPLLQFMGQSMTTAINTGFLLNLAPIFTIPFAYFFLKEKIKNKIYFILLVMLFGSYLLSTGGKLIFFQVGDFLIIILSVLIGFHTTFSKKIMKEVSPSLTSNFRIIFGTLFLSLVIPFYLGSSSLSALFQGPIYVFAAAFLLILNVTFFLKGVNLIGATLGSVFFILSSVFPAVLAYIFLGEVLSSIQIIGSILILVGGYWLFK